MEGAVGLKSHDSTIDSHICYDAFHLHYDFSLVLRV
jgi:hypothetical protein